MAALRAAIRELRLLAVTNVIMNSVSFYWERNQGLECLFLQHRHGSVCKEKRDQKLVGIELYLFSFFLTAKIYADSGYT